MDLLGISSRFSCRHKPYLPHNWLGLSVYQSHHHIPLYSCQKKKKEKGDMKEGDGEKDGEKNMSVYYNKNG